MAEQIAMICFSLEKKKIGKRSIHQTTELITQHVLQSSEDGLLVAGKRVEMLIQ